MQFAYEIAFKTIVPVQLEDAFLKIIINQYFQLNINQIDWLRSSGFDPEKENIILIHGYAGGDDTLPIVVLRDGKAFKSTIFLAFFQINEFFPKSLCHSWWLQRFYGRLGSFVPASVLCSCSSQH